MTTNTSNTHDEQPPDSARLYIRVNGEQVAISDRTPTGTQILAAAGLRPSEEYALLEWPATGPTREVALDEMVHLPHEGSPLEIYAARADGVLYFVLDDERYAWAGPLDGRKVRLLGRLAEDVDLWMERRDEADRLVGEDDAVHLEHAGVEKLYTRRRIWILDVQGERTEWHQPTVIVRDALDRAGIDLTKKWTILFRVKGKPPRQVALSDVLDLGEPGIERLWVRPDEVNNGDVVGSPRRQFSLLRNDETFLTNCSHQWETIIEAGRRWLVISHFPLPAGYNCDACRLAVEIPASYPGAQLDMFYCDPPLMLVNGGAPPMTESRETIDGVQFQRWSRHRPDGAWSPSKDSLATHFGLIDMSLAREVGA